MHIIVCATLPPPHTFPTPSLPQDAVVGRLSDPKAEVRTIACATLAGMIKGMGDAETTELRGAALANARLRLQQPGGASAASRGVKRGGGGGGGGGGVTVAAPAQPTDAAETLLQKHAAVLVGGRVYDPRGGMRECSSEGVQRKGCKYRECVCVFSHPLPTTSGLPTHIPTLA